MTWVARALLVACATLAALAPAGAQVRRRAAAVPNFRLSAMADWEFQQSSTTVQDDTVDASGFVQRYSAGLDGVVWDPRFARFSVGIEFLGARRRTDERSLSVRDVGYWSQLFLFNNRPFPLRVYARRSAADASGSAAVDDRRETASWGVEWRLLDHGARQLRALWDDTDRTLFAPPRRDQHQATGLVEFRQFYSRGEVSAQVNRQTTDETVIDTRRRRQNYLVTNRTKLSSTATAVVTLDRTEADATFGDGTSDRLTTDRAWLQFDLPGRGRAHYGVDYQYDGNSGKFVDATSHQARARARVALGAHWEATAGLVAGKLTSSRPGDESGIATTNVERTGYDGGLRYSVDVRRIHLAVGALAGTEQSDFDGGVSRREMVYQADAAVRVGLRTRDAAYGEVTHARNRNDTTGLGSTYDETRVTVGLDTDLSGARADTALEWRQTQYDTFQFGVQDSRTIGARTSLVFSRGSAGLSVSSRHGVSNYLPQPGNAGPIAPGTFLESDARIAGLNASYRFSSFLNLQLQATREERTFTLAGDENITTWHPELVWDWRTWRVSAGVAHFARSNGSVYRDTTWLLKVTKRFL